AAGRGSLSPRLRQILGASNCFTPELLKKSQSSDGIFHPRRLHRATLLPAILIAIVFSRQAEVATDGVIAKGEGLTAGGKGDDGDVGAADGAELLRLGEEALAPLGEGDASSFSILYNPHLQIPPFLLRRRGRRLRRHQEPMTSRKQVCGNVEANGGLWWQSPA
ncbi:unnamed protein product, partial [Musa acuminata subsp. malaccensis]